MRDGRCVQVVRTDRPVDENPGLVPIAVELVRGAELLPYFTHPEDALYIFGPEDGSVPPGILSACHRFVQIPALHCWNLGAAVFGTLYDRHAKRVHAGIELPLTLAPEGVGASADPELT